MKSVVKYVILTTLSALLTLLPMLSAPLDAAVAPMDNYCIKPPLIGATIKPNFLLLLDTSASMYDLAHISQGTYCYDNSYNNATPYEGYFEQTETNLDSEATTTVYYQYSFDSVSQTGKFNRLSAGSGLPASNGTYRTAYFDVVMSGTGASREVTSFIAEGRFLNWLTSSKFDIEKKILTGGKYDATKQVLIGESRGCAGRRFVKEIPASHFIATTATGMTFGVRGPNATEPDNPNNDTWGGRTRIEIYEHDYNSEDCLEAVQNWTDDVQGQWTTSAGDCLGLSGGAGTTSGRELGIFTEAARNCFIIKQNVEALKAGTTTPTEDLLLQSATIGNLKTQCKNVYVKDCNAASNDDVANCSYLNNKGAGNYICSRNVEHVKPTDIPYFSFFDPDPNDPATFDTNGFIGNCYDVASNAWDDTCVKRETLHFCGTEYSGSPVVDPSAGVLDTLETGNVPAIIMDAGLRAAGEPIRPSGCTLKKCSKTTATACTTNSDCPTGEVCKLACGFFSAEAQMTQAPAGLVQDFRNQVRIGVMGFNEIGSYSESPPLPTLAGNRDGGIIKYYPGWGKCSNDAARSCTTDRNCLSGGTCIMDGVGDHSTAGSVIKVLDDIQGSTWTPFAEGFYSAMGYFAPKKHCSTTTSTVCVEDRDCPTNETCKVESSRDDADLPRINAGDFDKQYQPTQYLCQKNVVLLVTDGRSTADMHGTVDTLAGLYQRGKRCSATTTTSCVQDADCPSGETCVFYQDGKTGECPAYKGSKNLDDLTYAARNRNLSQLRTGSDPGAPSSAPSSEYIVTYVVYNGTDPLVAGDECNAKTLLKEAAANGGTTLYDASGDPELFKTHMRSIFQKIAAESVSGTAASVLASGEGSGANLVQAVFFPTKEFGTTAIQWVGRLSNFWYYIDPQFASSNIREDSGDGVLTLKTGAGSNDYITKLYFDQNTNKAMAERYPDADGDTVPETRINPDIYIENVGYLWEAGRLLWKNKTGTETATSSSYRKILTVDVSSSTSPPPLMTFTTNNNSAALRSWMQISNQEVTPIISYVRGTDQTGKRPRKVSVDGVGPYEWKLGDILNSTPKTISWMPLNTYHKVYGDTTYGEFGKDPLLNAAADSSHYITSSTYKGRGMVFAGANDGMLHAFKMGRLELNWGQDPTSTQKARLVNPDTGNACVSTDTVPCGTEMWAFIPKNALPYLRYMADPAYCHIYTVDLTPYIFDASIGAVGAGDISASTRTASSWRTILIGGMRLGGACKDSAYAGTSGVKVPVADKGYSSYFALDVTDQNNPVLLWEFTNTNLGFATGGPAVVRVNAVNPSTSQPDKSLNGKWFVVFASGPTGPIDSNERQFLGQSDQELKLFVLDLKTGNLLATLPTGISDAFGGSIINSTHDIDLDYQDDVVYIPYVRKDATSGTWTQGGVVRLQTRENPAPSTTNWPVTKVIDGVGPVTSSVVKLQSTATNIMWLFFGTGRYFYEKEKATDDGTSVRSLYGIKDLCFSSTGFAASCGSSLSAGGLVDVTTDVVPPSTDLTSTSYTGWFINLDSHGDYTYAEGHPTPVDVTRRYWAERVITDPLAASTGVVFFTSYKPHDDPCKIGGKTFIWAVRYDTGGDPSSLLKGKALVQVSTGSIEQIDLSGAFGDKKQTGATGGRRSSAMEGVPPTAQGLSILSSPPALKRVLHIKER